jgi:hypothetical protein
VEADRRNKALKGSTTGKVIGFDPELKTRRQAERNRVGVQISDPTPPPPRVIPKIVPEIAPEVTPEAPKEPFGFDQRVKLLETYKGYGTTTGAALQGPSESEQMLIRAQEEAAERDINRLQDVLSGAGILSSGQLTAGTAQILGSARGEVAKTAAGFAESRLERAHEERLAKRQQLTSLVQSILL